MNYLKRIFLCTAFGGLVFTGFSQSIDPGSTVFSLQADQIARRHFGGSARMMGVAGAQTALGGDVSSVHVNPAGIGVYRSSDFGMTAGIQLNSTKTNFKSYNYENETFDNMDNFHLGNIGIVLAQSDASEYGGDWKSEGIAISYSRLSNYHTRFNYRNEGSSYNFRDYALGLGQNRPPSYLNATNFSIRSLDDDIVNMAYETFLLNDSVDKNSNFVDGYTTLNKNQRSTQEGEVTLSGGQSQWDFGYGANYKDKLYVGASMGIASYKRNVTTVYKEELESGTNTTNAEFRNLTYTTEEQSRGTGLNFKAGLIAKPSDIVRLGVSIETPTFYRVDVKYNSLLTTNYNGGVITFKNSNGNAESKSLTSHSAEGTAFKDDLSLRTPYRINTGVALFAGKKGFVSADFEYVMYNRTRISKFNGNSSGAFEDNNTLRNIYKNAFNVRLGGELRLNDLRLRAGYAYYPNTLKTDVLPSTKKQFITGGIGYYAGANYFDLAIVQATSYSDYEPFSGMSGVIRNKHNDLSVMLTYGFRF